MPAKSEQNNNKIPRKTKKAEKCRLEKEDFYPKRKGKTLFLIHLWPLEALKPLLEQSPVDPDR